MSLLLSMLAVSTSTVSHVAGECACSAEFASMGEKLHELQQRLERLEGL
jgi:hypothetical protein